MSPPFNSKRVAELDWRQGSVLCAALCKKARELAPENFAVNEDDWLIVTSHDCDVVNPRLEKEPMVEVLRGIPNDRSAPAKDQYWGRNPRTWQLSVTAPNTLDLSVTLECSVHERWRIPRQWLQEHAPIQQLPDDERRAMAEWLAKRYIRPAFPSAFDERWRSKLGDWLKLLKRNSQYIAGIYLRLNTLRELQPNEAYKCDFIVAVPSRMRLDVNWASTKADLETAIERFWAQFDQEIKCTGVDIMGTDEITLNDIARHQRFDADWISFVDDTEVIPIHRDLKV